jgi:hypothetical protein
MNSQKQYRIVQKNPHTEEISILTQSGANLLKIGIQDSKDIWECPYTSDKSLETIFGEPLIQHHSVGDPIYFAKCDWIVEKVSFKQIDTFWDIEYTCSNQGEEIRIFQSQLRK